MNENGKENEKGGRRPAAQGRAGGASPLEASGFSPDGRSSLTHDSLMGLAKRIERDGYFDDNLPEIIRQCAEHIANLEDEQTDAAYYRDLSEKENERIIELLQESQGLEIDIDLLRAEIERLRAALVDAKEAEQEMTLLLGNLERTKFIVDGREIKDGYGESVFIQHRALEAALMPLRKIRAALASCDERPSGLRLEEAQGASPPARHPEGVDAHLIEQLSTLAPCLEARGFTAEAEAMLSAASALMTAQTQKDPSHD